MLAALCSLNDTFRLELIQPLSDDGPYHDSLVAHGDADHLHHIRLGAADAAAAQAALARARQRHRVRCRVRGCRCDGATPARPLLRHRA